MHDGDDGDDGSDSDSAKDSVYGAVNKSIKSNYWQIISCPSKSVLIITISSVPQDEV